MEQKFTVENYEFYNEADAKAATEELAKVNAIHSKIDLENIAAVRALYIKAVEQNIFETQIGYSYLKELREYLISKDGLKSDEALIPILYTKHSLDKKNTELSEEYAVLKEKIQKQADEKLNTEKQKTLKAEKACKNRTILCVVLFFMVIFMFAITLTGKNPNILNYKTAITNQYAEWDQQLKEREDRIREKEAQLGISEP